VVEDVDLRPVPALDIGGSHVTAALVDVHDRLVVPGTRHNRPVRPNGTASEILGAVTACAAQAIGSRRPVGDTLGVAIPGPFDYATGIGRFEGVAKFEALAGVDVKAALLGGLAPRISDVQFLNDADGFAIGEWTAGEARGHDRALAITIGTGIGSAFLDRGHIVEDGPSVPPTGRVYLLRIDGQPLEDRVSRRAILRAAAGHPVMTASPGADVRELAEAARAGDAAARAIFDDAFDALGRALGPWLARFAATILVVGGAISASWDLVEPPLSAGLRTGELSWSGPVRRARLGGDAGLIGAAVATLERAADPSEAPHYGPAAAG
jgi:glucokinase